MVNSGNFIMTPDNEKTIKKMTAQLFLYPIADYLSSENFSLFCKEHDLVDVWREKLEFSRDIPSLYGGAVIENAFVLFLHHIFHSRPRKFLMLFTRILAGFSQAGSLSLPLDDLQKDLMDLGYGDKDLEPEFSVLWGNEEDRRKCRT
jgi:hypothetical protein